jgi:hypothetical protein
MGGLDGPPNPPPGVLRPSALACGPLGVPGDDTDDGVAAAPDLALDLELGAPLTGALLASGLAAAAAPPLTAPAIEDDLHRVVAAERAPQRLVERRSLALDDEKEPPDRVGHGGRRAAR